MAQKTTQRTNVNASGTTSINRSAPGVHAAPVDRTVVPEISNMSQLADGLKKVSPGFNKYLQGRHQKYVESESLAGEQAASLSKDEVDEKIALGELQPEQSPWFQQAYMRQSGINAGKRRALQLAESYNDPAQFNADTDDINKFFGDTLNADIEGLDDDDFKVGYLNAVRGAEDGIRKDYTAKHIEQVRKDVKEQAYQAYNNAFNDMGASGSYDVANLKTLAENARALNLQNHELNSLAYTAAVNHAMSGDGHPEVFEMFKNKGENGVASLYYTSDYADQIEKAQRQATALKTSKSAVLNNQVKFAAAQEWEDKLKATGGVYDFKALYEDVFDKESNPTGRLTVGQAEQIQAQAEKMMSGGTEVNNKELYLQFKDRAAAGEDIVEEVRASTLTLGQINTLEKSSLDARADKATQARIGSYLRTRPDLLHSEKPADIKRAAQSVLDEEFAQTGDINSAIIGSLDTLKKSGVLPPQIDSMLKTATPNNPDTWVQATNAYRILQEQAPVYLRQTFTDSKQSAMFDSFNAMTSYEGYTPEQAMEALNNRTPQQVEAGQMAFSNPIMKSTMFSKIASAFEGHAGYATMSRQVAEVIENRLQMPDAPQLTPDLIDEAVERVEARHVVIGNTWIDRQVPGANIDGLEDAVSDFLPSYYSNMNPQVGLEAVRIVPDAHTSADGSWVALDRNGARLPGRINVKEFVTDHKISTGDLLSQEERERSTVQGQYDALRKDLDDIDVANKGFTYWSEQGEADPKFLSNMKLREKTINDMKTLEERLKTFSGPRQASFSELFTDSIANRPN